ncbi:PQQ-binding-like beta-propeller repeat protein [Streptomyces sp. JL2001]|uniref:protein kinase domain-containing protein n=1 Tax=Streptomyces sp. JL2001 TaxID=3342488 RepID=UPI003D8056B3
MLSPLTHDDPVAIAAYRLLARLGSGGMGTVYLARSPGGRTVALKTMHARLATEADFRTRFQLETDAARIIGARHGAAVFDADPRAETPWLATEYVLGPPLDDAVSLCGPLPEPSVRALGAALAGALGQLHSSDVVHRDLKPSNVLVTAYGPKIIDFGIARAAGDDRLTRTGAAAGTPAFMSPEQAGGQEHTPAGDVFALAGVLLFAAAGHGPFGTGSPADLLYRVRYADPDLGGVPPDLAPLLADCLAKDPAARPTTAELAARLHDGHGDFADHLPPLVLADIARRATDVWLHQPYRLPPPADSALTPTAPGSGPSRRRLLTTAGGSVLGVAGAGVGAWAWLSSRDGGGGQGGGTPGPTATTTTPAPNGSDGSPRPLWQVDSYDRDQMTFPMLAGDVVGFEETASFRVLDPKTGRQLWEDNLAIEPQQVTTDGTYYYDSQNIDFENGLAIRTFRPRDGAEAARPVHLKGFDGSALSTYLLTAGAGMVVAYSRLGKGDDSLDERERNRHLVGIDLRTAKEAWRRPVSHEGVRRFLAQISGSRLIIGRRSGDFSTFRLEALDLRTGRPLWQRSFPMADEDYSLIPGELTLDGRHVYLGGQKLRAVRIGDGGLAWETGRAKTLYGVPAVSGDAVYATEGDRGLICVNAGTGRRLWEEKPPTRDLTPVLGARPVVGKAYVYAPVNGGLNAIDLGTRQSAWVFPTDATRYLVDRQRTRIFGAGETSVVALPLA